MSQPARKLSALAAPVAAAVPLTDMGEPVYDEGPMASEFMQVCTRGDVATLRDCLSADPGLVSTRDEGGRTGLHLAVRHPEATQFLLSHGADPNARENGDNVTPLHLAAAHGLLESVRILLDAGADPSIPDGDGVTALEHARSRGYDEIAALLSR